ncbi:MAG: autotransporter assembly complex protein TamA [Burkholderiaceae bacterium]
MSRLRVRFTRALLLTLALWFGLWLAPPAMAQEAATRDVETSRSWIDRIRGILPGAKPAPSGSSRPVRAERYPLQIEAPSAIERLLREHTLLGRWQRREDYDPSQMALFLARAPEEIAALLATQGYFSPEIEVGPLQAGARVLVRTGPLTRVSQVHLEFVDPDPQRVVYLRKVLEPLWPMPIGRAFVSQEWESAKLRLIEALRDEGLLRARIENSLAEVDPAQASAALSLRVVPGSPVNYGDFAIRGLHRYPRESVEGLSPFRAGERFDARKLALMQSRLAGAGWFATAHVRPDLHALQDDPARPDVPILVDIVEHPAQRLTFSGGLDADHGPSGEVQWEHYNHWGLGIRSVQGAHADRDRQTVFSTWETPQGRTGWRVQGGVRYEQRDVSNDLVMAGQVFLARLQRDGLIERGWSLQWQDELQSIMLGPGAERRDRNSALVLGWSWTRRDLDSPVFPTFGQVLNLQLSAAHDGLGSERSFARAYALALQLMPLRDARGREWSRLILRAELGHVHADAREGIPSTNLFRTGGSKSVRGYASQSLGVHLGEATIGGRVLAVGSIEWQRPIDEHWAWALFADAGDATDRWQDWRARWGVGTGVRWRTPVGPLQVDLARGIQAGQWRLHASLGVVF